jgi:hypothetical protein
MRSTLSRCDGAMRLLRCDPQPLFFSGPVSMRNRCRSGNAAVHQTCLHSKSERYRSLLKTSKSVALVLLRHTFPYYLSSCSFCCKRESYVQYARLYLSYLSTSLNNLQASVQSMACNPPGPRSTTHLQCRIYKGHVRGHINSIKLRHTISGG